MNLSGHFLLHRPHFLNDELLLLEKIRDAGLQVWKHVYYHSTISISIFIVLSSIIIVLSSTMGRIGGTGAFKSLVLPKVIIYIPQSYNSALTGQTRINLKHNRNGWRSEVWRRRRQSYLEDYFILRLTKFLFGGLLLNSYLEDYLLLFIWRTTLYSGWPTF